MSAAEPERFSLLQLCAAKEDLTSFWKAASIQELERGISSLLSDVQAFEIECESVFRANCKSGRCIPISKLTYVTNRLAERLCCQECETLAHITALLSAMGRASTKRQVDINEFSGYLASVLARIHHRLNVLARGLETAPPVRLRMQSADMLCARSMEVEWENGTGQRQSWSSWDDQIQNGWFEAEKVLPSTVTDISVQFKARGLLIESSDVCKVDRKSACSWVTDRKGSACPVETIWLRAGQGNAFEPVDVVFQMKGPLAGCHVARAWNVARFRIPEAWEHWERFSRPRAPARLPTLKAADAAAAPNSGLGDPTCFVDSRQKRLSAAASKLIEIRRETINGLRKLDEAFTAQWLGVNTANTAAAGLAVGSAALMFACPPVGVGLGLAAAATGTATTAADMSEDHYNMKEFREQMAADMCNTIAVAELENAWLNARDESGQALGAWKDKDKVDSPKVIEDLSVLATASLATGAVASAGMEAASSGLVAVSSTAARTASTGGATSSGALAASSSMTAGAVASRAFGVFGAVAATGLAVHGWCTTKLSQQAVRSALADMTSSLLYMQRWLAGFDDLECPICLEPLGVTDQAQRCANNWHYFHSSCLQDWCNGCAQRQIEPTCPECRCELATTDSQALDEFITSDVRTHLRDMTV